MLVSKNIEQNKNLVVIFSVLIIISLLFSLFSVPVLADFELSDSFYPSSLTVAPVCDPTASSLCSSGYQVSYNNSFPNQNVTIVGSYYEGDELVCVACFRTDSNFYFVRSYDSQSSRSSTLRYGYYHADAPRLSTVNITAVDGYDIGYSSSSLQSFLVYSGPVYSSEADGFAACASLFSNYSFSATPNPDPLSIAPICDLSPDSFASSGYIFSFQTSNPDSNRTIIGSYFDGGELVLVAGFLTSTQAFTVRSYNPSSSSNQLVYRSYNGELLSSTISTSLVPDGLNIGYRATNRASSYTQLGQVFESAEAGLIACSNLFDAYFSASSSLEYALPPGNVAFIEVDSGNTFSLDTRFIEITGLFSGSFSKTSQTWGWSDSVVSSGSFPLSGHALIPWQKGSTTNLVGQSHFGSVTGSLLSGSGKYLVIYNPLYSFQTDSESNFEHNFNVNIHCSAVKTITVVSLKGNLASGIESSWTMTSIPDGEIYSGSIDPTTGVPSFVDSQGNSGSPTYGGDNYIEDSTQNFKGWLNGIVSSFLGVLNSGRDAILNLVSGASAFFSVFPSLYSWLPSPVLSVLTSALILVLAIGLIKVLL